MYKDMFIITCTFEACGAFGSDILKVTPWQKVAFETIDKFDYESFVSKLLLEGTEVHWGAQIKNFGITERNQPYVSKVINFRVGDEDGGSIILTATSVRMPVT